MPTRISGACNGCRSRKQKCSGDRSQCKQCLAAGIPCTWPEQRKRGPAKGYIDGLENRLREAESLLLNLLPLIPDTQLQASMSEPIFITGEYGEESGFTQRRLTLPLLNKKTGPEYWDNFPLDSAENVRRWQDDCDAQAKRRSSSRNVVEEEDFMNNDNTNNTSAGGAGAGVGAVGVQLHIPLIIGTGTQLASSSSHSHHLSDGGEAVRQQHQQHALSNERALYESFEAPPRASWTQFADEQRARYNSTTTAEPDHYIESNLGNIPNDRSDHHHGFEMMVGIDQGRSLDAVQSSLFW